jgi:hypothetical protein
MGVCLFGDQAWKMNLLPYHLLILEQVLLNMVRNDSSEQSKINNHKYIVDIAVDWISDKIYWTNSNQIMVYDLQRGYQSTVINSDTVLHQVLVDPNAR